MPLHNAMEKSLDNSLTDLQKPGYNGVLHGHSVVSSALRPRRLFLKGVSKSTFLYSRTFLTRTTSLMYLRGIDSTNTSLAF